jgi:hypothetical protein
MGRRDRLRCHLPSLAAAVLAVAGLVGISPPSAAGANGPCPGTTGVTVVVDFQGLGGGIVTRCATGSPASGFKALEAVGLSVTQVQNMYGFLCRIDGRPAPAQEDCLHTPPATAYWSYWRANRGEAWVANSEGGLTRKPPAGSVDGWSFSSGGKTVPPGIAPPAEPATPKPTVKPTPKPTPRPTPKPTAKATPVPATPRATADGATREPTAGVTPTPLPSESSGSASATTAPTASVAPSDPTSNASSRTPSATAVAIADGSDPPAPGPDVASTGGGGPPVGTILGLALVAAVAGVALLARSRRSTGAGRG